MRFATLALAVVTVFLPSPADKVTRETFSASGAARTYYVCVPESPGERKPVPLVVLLHGSGRNGLSLVERWKDLASKEGFALAGPDALQSAGWSTGTDGPDFLHDLVELLKTHHAIDPKRVYLFGHSAGAIHALLMGLLESQYFAATAVHAGALPANEYAYIAQAARKIPTAMWVGTNDAFFPVAAVRATRDALAAAGVPVTLTEIKGHTHDYYSRANDINRDAWAFLKSHALEVDPIFQRYQIAR
jgi:poly(3-hydroxybutyrate) depolymerase